MDIAVHTVMVTIIPVRIVMLPRPWWWCRDIIHKDVVMEEDMDMEDVDGKIVQNIFIKIQKP
jgi:hypothetical protein